MHRSNDEIIELIKPFSPLNCWKVGLQYGSSIYFEMKDKSTTKMLDGSVEDVGTCRLVIYARSWLIQENKNTIVKSDDVTREIAENDLNKKFLENELLYISFANKNIVLAVFSSNLNIALSVAMQKNDTDNLLHLTLPDGSLYAANKASGFYKSA